MPAMSGPKDFTALSKSLSMFSEKQRSIIFALCPSFSRQPAVYSNPMGGTGGDINLLGLTRRIFMSLIIKQSVAVLLFAGMFSNTNGNILMYATSGNRNRVLFRGR